MGNLQLPVWGGRSGPGQAVAVWLLGRCQISSHWLLASRQRRAIMASAPATVHLMPESLRRWATIALHPPPRRRSRRTGPPSQPSARAASAASLPTLADASAASASRSPLSPPAGGAPSSPPPAAADGAGLASQIASFTSRSAHSPPGTACSSRSRGAPCPTRRRPAAGCASGRPPSGSTGTFACKVRPRMSGAVADLGDQGLPGRVRPVLSALVVVSRGGQHIAACVVQLLAPPCAVDIPRGKRRILAPGDLGPGEVRGLTTTRLL